eukprot:6154110-Prymnesium_polylepis.1
MATAAVRPALAATDSLDKLSLGGRLNDVAGVFGATLKKAPTEPKPKVEPEPSDIPHKPLPVKTPERAPKPILQRGLSSRERILMQSTAARARDEPAREEPSPPPAPEVEAPPPTLDGGAGKPASFQGLGNG